MFFTDHPSLVKSTEVISGVSDHEAVTIENNLSLPHRKQPKRRIYLWNKADPIKIRTETRKFAQDFLNNVELGVNDMWTSINSKLLEKMNNWSLQKNPPLYTSLLGLRLKIKDTLEINNFGIRGLKRKTIATPGRNIRNTKL